MVFIYTFIQGEMHRGILLMEFSSALDLDEVDLNSLLLSHGGETDSDEEDRHRRTVDEIILNHSSSSPSPPSSPSHPLHADGENNASTAPIDRRLSHSHSTPLVDSDNYKFDSAVNTSRLNYAGRVLPPLLGNGAVRSNAKPGAALAAAAAASRSIPTPHATAIKLRRASTVVPALQKSLSETAVNNDSADSSPSAAPSDVHLSQSQEEGAQVPLGNIYSGSTISVVDDDRDCGVYPPEDRHLHKAGEQATLEESYGVQSVNASNIEIEKDQIHVIEHASSPSLSGKNEECPEISTVDESGGNEEMVLLPASSDVDHDIIGGEEASGFENTVSGDGDYASAHNDDAAELLEDFISREDGEDENSNLQQKSDYSLKPLDLAEEIEKKQAFTGLHYEEGAAAQPMRLEGVKRATAVLGYFDVRSDNIITETISSQAFRRDHGSPQVLAVHLSYIAVGMSKGSIFVVPSKYTAHHVDNMDIKVSVCTYACCLYKPLVLMHI